MTLLEKVIEQIYLDFDIRDDEDNRDIDEFISTISEIEEEHLIELLSVVYFQQVLLDGIFKGGFDIERLIKSSGDN